MAGLCDYFACSKTTIYSRVLSDCDFPPALPTVGCRRYWALADVDEYAAKLAARRDDLARLATADSDPTPTETRR